MLSGPRPSDFLGPVLVGVDGSQPSLRAVDVASHEAAARSAPMELLHVGATNGTAEILATAAGRALSRHPALDVTTGTAPGDVVRVLTERAERACLLVIGHRGHSGRRGSTAGSVALRLVDTVRVPVLVCRPIDPPAPPAVEPYAPRPVLLGLDLGTSVEGLDDTLEFAYFEADLRGTSLQIMCLSTDVVEHTARTKDGVDPMHMIGDHVELWSAKYPHIAVRLTARPGLDPAIALAAGSQSAQLVVVSSPGLTRGGSITRALVHRSSCPVAVIAAPTFTTVLKGT